MFLKNGKEDGGGVFASREVINFSVFFGMRNDMEKFTYFHQPLIVEYKTVYSKINGTRPYSVLVNFDHIRIVYNIINYYILFKKKINI